MAAMMAKICTLCADNTAGDEYHYLFKSVYFYNEIVRLIDAKYDKHPSRHSFSELLKVTQPLSHFSVSMLNISLCSI